MGTSWMPSIALAWLAVAAAACGASPAAPSPPVPDGTTAPRIRSVTGERLSVEIDPGEADAVLAMTAAADRDAAWQRVFGTSGFRRLAARERSMKRELDLEQFRAFAGSPELAARAGALRATVEEWLAIDLATIASRVFGYLPGEARIAATVYPVIKPRDNSFVFFDEDGAAIFVFVDPAVTAAQLDNTVAHELHHVGFASLPDAPCKEAAAVCAAREWAGAFGEGFAMLAAAGGPDVHPHRASKPADRARWDRDVLRFDEDLRSVEAFLRDVIDGKLDADAARERAMGFFGIQGPWYTVGYTMAVAIERCAGRAALIEAMRRPWTTLGLYNEVRDRCPTRTGSATARWAPGLVRALGT